MDEAGTGRVSLTNLSEARVNAGFMSPDDFAKSVGVPPTSYRQYEASRCPNAALIVKFADALGCSVDYLLGRDSGSAYTGPLSEFEAQLVMRYRIADPRIQAAIAAILDYTSYSPSAPADDYVVTAQEAADALGVSTRRVYSLVKDGHLASVKQAGNLLISRRSLDNELELRRSLTPGTDPKDVTPDDFRLDVAEAADKLGVKSYVVYRMIDTGRLDAVKEGRTWRISESCVERLNTARTGRS